MITITLDGIDYRTSRRLNAFEQFHVGRKLAPVMAVLGINMIGLIAQMPSKPEEGVMLGMVVPFLAPMSEVLAKMSHEDCDFVLNHSMGVIERRVTENQWQKVLSSPGNFMFEDIDMRVMLHLVVIVIRENLADFLKGRGVEQPSPSS